MVADRKTYIQNNIDEAQNQRDEASADRQKANEELVQAKVKAAEIVVGSKLIAEKEANRIKLETTQKTIRMLDEAKADIRMQKILLATETKEEIVEVALAAAKKIVEKEVDNNTNRKLVEDYIKES